MSSVRVPYYRRNLFFVINVVRYTGFCKNVDYINDKPVDRVTMDAEWDKLIDKKFEKWDDFYLMDRWPTREQEYGAYISGRAHSQKFNAAANAYWKKKEEHYQRYFWAPGPRLNTEEQGDTWSPELFYGFIDSLHNKDNLSTLDRAAAAREAQQADPVFGLFPTPATKATKISMWKVKRILRWKEWSRPAELRRRQVVESRLAETRRRQVVLSRLRQAGVSLFPTGALRKLTYNARLSTLFRSLLQRGEQGLKHRALFAVGRY